MKEKFEEWAIVELFGHQKIAGRISEQQIGGTSFVRVDVPEIDGQHPLTKLFGSGAIYAITITDEQTARAAAKYWKPIPMDRFTLANMALPAPLFDDQEG